MRGGYFGILDRYIIKKYLATFFFTVLIFTMISVVIDFSDKVESYMRESIPLQAIIFDYTIKFALNINALLWPTFALIAVVFFTSRLAANSEVIAILNAGVSYPRFLFPFVVAASIVAGILLVLNHTVIPVGNKTRLDFEHKYIWKDSDKGKTNNVHIFLDKNTKAYIRSYSKTDTSGRQFRLEKFSDGALDYILTARKIEWLGPPGNWRLRDYYYRELGSDGPLNTLSTNEERLKLGIREQMDTLINLTPEDFVLFLNEKERMSTKDLKEAIAVQHLRGLGQSKLFKMEIMRRTADPISIIILTIIGVSVASRKVRGGMGGHLAVGIAIGALFVFASKFSVTLAYSTNISPGLAIWLPNILFSIVAIYMVSRAQQ